MDEQSSHNKKRWQKAIRGFVPKHIKNRTVIGFMDLFRKVERFFRRLFWGKKRSELQVGFEGIIPGQLIENQNALAHIPLGHSNMAYAGCEVIAVYNALLSLQKNVPDVTDLIADFQRDGIICRGHFGVSPKAILDYLKKGQLSLTFSTKEEEFEEILQKSDGVIFTMYNDKQDLFMMIHTIFISKEERGFVAHNVYGDGNCVGPFGTLEEFMELRPDKSPKGIAMIGINRL